MKKKRILVIGSVSGSLVYFRGDFIKDLIKNDFEVYAAAPNFRDEIIEKLNMLGAIPVYYKLQRTGLNPFKDLSTIFQLKKIIKDKKIDLVFPYTIKPVLYSSVAARMCKVPVISLITGLGFTFSGMTKKARRLQKLNVFLYKLGIRKNEMVIFQNSDDYQLFLDSNILTKKNKVGFVGGSGVNLKEYKYRVNDKQSDDVSFVLVARLIKEKGVELFVDAAEKLKKKYPKTQFHVIGIVDKSPSAIKLERLETLNNNGTIVYHGPQKNVGEHLFKRDVFVLPTYYREGVPRSILEALSVGMPIITTDSPGCRETVMQNKNGFLIKPKDFEELVSAMEYFIVNKSKIKQMGINSREYAEQKFDVNIINKQLIDSINLVLKN